MSPPLRIEERESKGRTVIASQPLKSGQIILTDSPLLLYSSQPFVPNPPPKYCSHCFSLLSSSLPCPSCLSPFCSPACLSQPSHSPWACRAVLGLRGYPGWARYPEEVQVQARFLVAAYNLAGVCPDGFRRLLGLQGEGGEERERESAVVLNSILDTVGLGREGFGEGFGLETTAALLAKDRINAFGLMEPFGGGKSPSPEQVLVPALGGSGEQQQHRSVRAYGIYPNASLFNHDCLPNACRFDYIDQNKDASSSSKNNTDIVIRMIHDVPEGREICLSYFPVNLSYRERQLRLRDDYGFVCSCDRCQVEANWSCSDDDDDDGNDVAMDEDEDADESMEAGEDEEGNEKENDFPHAYFFLRYMCTQQDCWGTLAPLPTPPSSNGTTTPSLSFMVMECNVCGNLKNDEQEVTDCQPKMI